MATVLVVDDDPDIRTMLTMALALDGHRVSSGHDGGSGIEELRRLVGDGERPVVILDVEMPGLDGWAVLELIRSDPDLDDVPVTICTVKAHQPDIDRGASLGCDAYQSKPFDIGALSQHVTELAERDPTELRAVRELERERVSG